MQEKTIESAEAIDFRRRTIEAVANDRMMDARQVDPDLVGAAGRDAYL